MVNPDAGKHPVLVRIEQQLKQVKKSARAAALEGGLGADAIRDLFRRPKMVPRLDTIEKLAPPLQTTPEYLAFGVSDGAARVAEQMMPVKGEVAA